MFRLKGSILSMSFLDCNGALIPYSFEAWKDEQRETTKERRDRNIFFYFSKYIPELLPFGCYCW